MNDPVFDVTYRVGIGNLNAFFCVWWKRTWFDKTNWKRFGIYALALVVLHMFAVKNFARKPISHDPAINFSWLMVLGVGAIVMSAVYAFVLVFLLSPLFTYAAQLIVFTLGPARKRISQLKVDVGGIDKTIGTVDSRTKWRDLTDMVVTKRMVLLFTNRNSATIVPKSAFASPANAEAFAAFAKAHWEDARSVF